MDSLPLGILQFAELRQTEDMGMGIFATQNISYSTPILREPAILSVQSRTTMDITRFCEAYTSLGVLEAAQFDNLHHVRRLLDLSSSVYNRFHDWVTTRMGNVVWLKGSDQRKVRRLVRAHATFISNCADASPDRIAVFPMYSRFNHSCDPNISWGVERYGDEDFVVLASRRDILAGEQLFLSYFGVTQYRRPWRQQQLNNWDFNCTCPRCVSETSGGGAGYQMRADPEYDDVLDDYYNEWTRSDYS